MKAKARTARICVACRGRSVVVRWSPQATRRRGAKTAPAPGQVVNTGRRAGPGARRDGGIDVGQGVHGAAVGPWERPAPFVRGGSAAVPQESGAARGAPL